MNPSTKVEINTFLNYLIENSFLVSIKIKTQWYVDVLSGEAKYELKKHLYIDERNDLLIRNA